MSIWKDLYDIFDKERSTWKQAGADKQAILFEILSNLNFLGDALQTKLSQEKIIKRLEVSVFNKAIRDGFNFNSISKAKVTTQTIGEFEEFKKYIGKDTAYLIKNVYLKISSLSKLTSDNPGKDYSLKLKSLVRFLVLLVAHIEGGRLIITNHLD